MVNLMKANKLANYYVTLGVFLMVTVAVVAGQSRAGQVDPLLAELKERVGIEIQLTLDRAAVARALNGHN